MPVHGYPWTENTSITKRGIILGHTLAFVVLAAVYVLLIAESLVELLMLGYDQVAIKFLLHPITPADITLIHRSLSHPEVTSLA